MISRKSERISERSAADFGLIGSEVTDAIARIIKFAFEKSAALDNRFNRDDIQEQLANFRQPRSLLDPRIRQLIQDKLDEFRGYARMNTPIIRRTVLNQMTAQLTYHS